jgi:hypothetical protein
MNLDGIIGGSSVLVAGLITSASPIRSRLKTPIMRAVAAGVVAAALAVVGEIVFNPR